MNRHDFLDELRSALAKLPQSDLDEILYDYDEHFRSGLAEGKTEGMIIKSLGDPKTIARQYKAYYMVKKAETAASAHNIARAVLATASLGFFNLMIILWPLIVLIVLLLMLFTCSIAVTVSGVVLFLEILARPLIPEYLLLSFDPSVHPAAIGFFGIGLIASGLLLLIGSIVLIRLFYTWTVKYLKLNQKIIMGAKSCSTE